MSKFFRKVVFNVLQYSGTRKYHDIYWKFRTDKVKPALYNNRSTDILQQLYLLFVDPLWSTIVEIVHLGQLNC